MPSDLSGEVGQAQIAGESYRLKDKRKAGNIKIRN